MRVSIERGYHTPIKQLMGQLKTDDPKLAVHHIIGCWLASGGCPGAVLSPSASQPVANQQQLSADDEFAQIMEF